MKTVATFAEVRALSRGCVGFVPTMGYLHEGHLSLIDAARRECDIVVVSLFVNPLQFGPNEDLASYPRDLDRDARLLETAGADVLFAPPLDVMYPSDPLTTVTVGGSPRAWRALAGPDISTGSPPWWRSSLQVLDLIGLTSAARTLSSS